MPEEPVDGDSRSERHRKAAHSHDLAATRHDTAAAFWTGRDDDRRADLERRNAQIERDAAQLERERADLEEEPTTDS